MNSYVGQLQDELDVPKTGPIFTVVIPAYNVEDYLEEAVQSILNQDIGFEDHVEIVIVNDGSTDKSGEIADRLAHKYPANIHVIHQANQGVSMARNNGMAQAKGLYVGFLDPDDKYSHETFRHVKSFFDVHGNEVDVVGIPIVFFEAQQGDHPLNVKFDDGTRVIDIEEKWFYHQSAVMSAFMKSRF
ncbi:putative glycosyltransferase [Corynebacterium renale]|uniref:glycosyltransferase n=1 Tax=Corynebacterium renale TaxID=1724 RepID=UPI000DA2A59A|nr:glycosyltransferase [Corynebacterium renale]SQG63803.1 putative glycosyltransferase [Corynebacterium renale]